MHLKQSPKLGHYEHPDLVPLSRPLSSDEVGALRLSRQCLLDSQIRSPTADQEPLKPLVYLPHSY